MRRPDVWIWYSNGRSSVKYSGWSGEVIRRRRGRGEELWGHGDGVPCVRIWGTVFGIHKGSDCPSLSQTTDQESPQGRRLLQTGTESSVFRLDLRDTQPVFGGLNSRERYRVRDKPSVHFLNGSIETDCNQKSWVSEESFLDCGCDRGGAPTFDRREGRRGLSRDPRQSVRKMQPGTESC